MQVRTKFFKGEIKTDATAHGTVYRKSRGAYFIQVDGRMVVCSISSKLRKILVYPIADASSVRQRVVDVERIRAIDPIAIGDEVGIIEDGAGGGMIKDILPRRNEFRRKTAGNRPWEQVMVANVDQVVPVFSVAKPKPKWGMLDRYLVSAEAAEVPALICITKMDLAEGDSLMETLRVYETIGYPVITTSVMTPSGIDEITAVLKERTSVLVGKSGVGKTTLLNAIQADLGLKVREVSGSTGKGKHTTSHLEMFPLDIGGAIIDTPGMREFGLLDLSKRNLAELFPEMHPLIGQCKFEMNCAHKSEPGCAIKQAVETGEIAYHRYQSYMKIK
jgi:ribosome biogenesis GTPase